MLFRAGLCPNELCDEWLACKIEVLEVIRILEEKEMQEIVAQELAQQRLGQGVEATSSTQGSEDAH